MDEGFFFLDEYFLFIAENVSEILRIANIKIYSIILLSNLFFHFLEIIWILKIFNTFLNCKILIF